MVPEHPIENSVTAAESTVDSIELEKRNRLQKIREEIENIADFTGRGIDENIKEQVSVLHALGFNTTNSCEGHIDHGVPYPFIDIEAPDKPKWRYEGEQELFQKVAQERGKSLDVLDRQNSQWDVDQYEEVFGETARRLNELAEQGDLVEIDAFKQWQGKNKRMHEAFLRLLDGYYATKEPDYKERDERVIAEGPPETGFQVRCYAGFTRVVDSLDYMEEMSKKNWKLSDEEESLLQKKLQLRQQEMKKFGDFLKQQYFKDF